MWKSVSACPSWVRSPIRPAPDVCGRLHRLRLSAVVSRQVDPLRPVCLPFPSRRAPCILGPGSQRGCAARLRQPGGWFRRPDPLAARANGRPGRPSGSCGQGAGAWLTTFRVPCVGVSLCVQGSRFQGAGAWFRRPGAFVSPGLRPALTIVSRCPASRVQGQLDAGGWFLEPYGATFTRFTAVYREREQIRPRLQRGGGAAGRSRR